MKRFQVVFRYRDKYCYPRWNTQSNIVYGNSSAEAVAQVCKINGLGVDCEYEIVDVVEVAQ